MFKQLVNEAYLTFHFHTESPLAIKSGENTELDPTAPKMLCMRTRSGDGIKGTVFIPGSSLKGVIRSRIELIAKAMASPCCNVVDRKNPCSDVKPPDTGDRGVFVYRRMCPACRMFGSTSIGSRVRFVDAYPAEDKKPVIGKRDGVGINRITGAAQQNVKFDIEVVEDATFKVEIFLRNYELYQLKLLLYALRDLHTGYANLGGGGSRGFGRMSVTPVSATFRDYRPGAKTLKGFRDVTDEAGDLSYQDDIFCHEATLGVDKLANLDAFIHLLDSVDVRKYLNQVIKEKGIQHHASS